MRSSTRRALTLGCFAFTALAWSGCEAKKQTEYVAGVSTQVQVPRDLKAIRIDVSVGGIVQFCQSYRVYDGKVQLPRSLGEFPSQGKPGPNPITVTVSGFTEPFSESSGNTVFSDCVAVAPKVGAPGQGTRILRRSRQPYVADSVLFLPMPLKFSCYDKDCGDDESMTCKAGVCVSSTTDEKKLPKFTDELVDGTGGACFNASFCFAAGAPAAVVNADDCTYAVPNSPPSSPPQIEGAPPNPFPNGGEGVNVEVAYDGGLNREILDKEEQEGFTIPDPAKPQQFRLAPGLCELVKGYGAPDATHPEGVPTAHRITAVRASGTCRAKGQFQPLCAADQLAAMGVDATGLSALSAAPDACKSTELRPPKAALIVLADDTHNSDLFYSAAAQSTLGLSLADPAFQKTELGLGFFPGPGTCAAAGSFTPVVQPKLARLAKPDVVAQFSAVAANMGALLKPIDSPVNLDGALRDAYATLAADKFSTYYRRAVLVLGNRGFDQATCGQTPAQRAAAAHTTNGIDTYVLMLARNTQIADVSTLPPGAAELATAGATIQAYDARANKAPAQDAFQTVVNNLATCVYDVDDAAARPVSGDLLSYTNPIDPTAKTETLAFNGACSSEDVAGVGFGLDPGDAKRMYLCKASCEAYRGTLRNASLYAAQNGQPPIAVPVFSHKAGCTVTASGGAGSGNGG
ncbi:MAG: hypothetical protein JWP87_5827 [Labilithrix sp.]|nr:hypothetical protein [Labilithrix sp.]